MELKEKLKRKVRKNMRTLGTYKEEYEDAIEKYVDAQIQYKVIWNEYEHLGYPSIVECAGGVKKHPILNAMEDARKQVALWSDKLGLNPKALENMKKIETSTESTGLEKALEGFANVAKQLN